MLPCSLLLPVLRREYGDKATPCLHPCESIPISGTQQRLSNAYRLVSLGSGGRLWKGSGTGAWSSCLEGPDVTVFGKKNEERACEWMRKFYDHATYVHAPLAVTDLYTITLSICSYMDRHKCTTLYPTTPTSVHSLLIGVSLSEPHTSVTALWKCVFVLVCLWPYTVNFKCTFKYFPKI